MLKDKELKPDDYLATRNWREFFRSLPDDAENMEFRVRNPQDLMNIRVTASQLRKERKYKLAIDFAKSTISVTVGPAEDDGRDC